MTSFDPISIDAWDPPPELRRPPRCVKCDGQTNLSRTCAKDVWACDIHEAEVRRALRSAEEWAAAGVRALSASNARHREIATRLVSVASRPLLAEFLRPVPAPRRTTETQPAELADRPLSVEEIDSSFECSQEGGPEILGNCGRHPDGCPERSA